MRKITVNELNIQSIEMTNHAATAQFVQQVMLLLPFDVSMEATKLVQEEHEKSKEHTKVSCLFLHREATCCWCRYERKRSKGKRHKRMGPNSNVHFEA